MRALLKTRYVVSIFVLCIIFVFYCYNKFSTNKPSTTNVLYLWSQVVSNDLLSVRAIVEGNSQCPPAYVNNKAVAMTERVQSSGEGFPEKVCQLLVARNTQDVSINGQKVPVLKDKISKIAFIGDSGCILPDGKGVCNDETWPLRENLKSLSTHKPDLIAHLGDYQYREIAKCYPEQFRSECAKCVKKADTFHAWQEEWLNPSTEILKDFPMLFIRGNHENYDYCSEQYCNSSYKAWYRYFDINPSIPDGEVNIKKEDDSWIFDTGSLQFYVLDSSCCDSDDNSMDLQRVDHYKKQFTFFNTHASLDKSYWLIAHKQFWNHREQEKPSDLGVDPHSVINENLLHAFKDTPIKNISAIMSGHIHMAQILLMNDAPTQIISGNGGGLLYNQNIDPVTYNIKFNTVDGLEFSAKEVLSFFGFGFAILDLDNRKFSFYSKDNKELYSTNLTEDFRFIAPTISKS